jgi:A/G-specific adenine glycosylase
MTKSDSSITGKLLAWYRRHRRILPWREYPDPYGIWISEIMLQQTQVETVIPYYHHFLERFPTVAALAAAPLEEILKAWENLGYYARACNLHQAAKCICEKFKGKIPDTWETIITLPGIGAYTAGAILSIAFGKPIPAVDGNVRRVLSRLFAIEAPIGQTDTQKAIQALAAALVPKKSPGLFNQALMDLGAIICTPKTPACADCPLRDLCRARQAGLQDRLPLSAKKPPRPHEYVTAAVIRNRKGKVLIVQRPAQGLLASLWKFPGGIVKKGDSIADGLRRTVHEELGIRIQVGQQTASINHAYTHFRITLHAFRCTLCAGRPRTLACQAWRWASPEDLENLAFSKVDRAIISAI